jgi:outer membrane protein OmpA-like peptidoglycan-associated protein
MRHHRLSRRAVLATVASCAILLPSGIALAQPVQVFEETPSLEELRRIIVPESHGAGRAIVIQHPQATERSGAGRQSAGSTPYVAGPQAIQTPAAKMPVPQTRGPTLEARLSTPPAPPGRAPAVQAEAMAPVSEAAEGIFALRINFALDSALLPSTSYTALDRIAELMKQEPQIALRIEGHTDALGSADYNLLLSRRRAFAVAHYLVHHRAIEQDRLAVVGKGMTEPLTKNPYDPRNRRVQFVRDDKLPPLAPAPSPATASEKPTPAATASFQLPAAELTPSAVPASLAAAQPQPPSSQNRPPSVVGPPDFTTLADTGQQREQAAGPEPVTIDRRRLAQAEELILSRTVDNKDILQSLGAAIRPLEAAAQRGDPAAAYDVGYCYEHGIGVRPDRAKAYAYYIRSAGALAELKVKAAALSGAQALIVKLTDEEYQEARQILQTDAP